MKFAGTAIWGYFEPWDTGLQANLLSMGSPNFLCCCILVMGHGYDANARTRIDHGMAVCMIDNDRPLYVCKRVLL
jgi:hypothetical protein